MLSLWANRSHVISALYSASLLEAWNVNRNDCSSTSLFDNVRSILILEPCLDKYSSTWRIQVRFGSWPVEPSTIWLYPEMVSMNDRILFPTVALTNLTMCGSGKLSFGHAYWDQWNRRKFATFCFSVWLQWGWQDNQDFWSLLSIRLSIAFRLCHWPRQRVLVLTFIFLLDWFKIRVDIEFMICYFNVDIQHVFRTPIERV